MLIIDNIIKIASDMDLSQIKDIVREAQEDINSNGPAWILGHKYSI